MAQKTKTLTITDKDLTGAAKRQKVVNDEMTANFKKALFRNTKKRIAAEAKEGARRKALSERRKYFKVTVEKHSHLKLYNLRVERLVKKSEAILHGFAPHDHYRFACMIQGIGERDAECITMALENLREPLQAGAESTHWAEKLAALQRLECSATSGSASR